MNLHIRTTVILLLIAAFVISATACNTMKGVGKDTEAVGEKIEKEADRHLDDEDSRP